MIVSSDTTPIISLLKAERLDLLQKLYKVVLVPQAVYKELINNPQYAKEADIIKTTEFLSVMDVENRKSVAVLRSVSGLDAGESEALIMYDEQKADLLLIDEHKGRSIAKQLNVRYIGTAGILMLSYDKGLISAAEVKRCMDIMIENGIRLSRKLCNTVMVYVGLTEQY